MLENGLQMQLVNLLLTKFLQDIKLILMSLVYCKTLNLLSFQL